MCSSKYDNKIDIWAVGIALITLIALIALITHVIFTHMITLITLITLGCVMAELLGRKPLFPGSDYLDQMNLILKVK